MHNNVKFVLKERGYSSVVGQLLFRCILEVGVCAFPHVLGMEKSTKIAAQPPPPPEDNFWNSPKLYDHFTSAAALLCCDIGERYA